MEEREQIGDGFASEEGCQQYYLRSLTGLVMVQVMADTHVKFTLKVDPVGTNPFDYDGYRAVR